MTLIKRIQIRQKDRPKSSNAINPFILPSITHNKWDSLDESIQLKNRTFFILTADSTTAEFREMRWQCQDVRVRQCDVCLTVNEEIRWRQRQIFKENPGIADKLEGQCLGRDAEKIVCLELVFKELHMNTSMTCRKEYHEKLKIRQYYFQKTWNRKPYEVVKGKSTDVNNCV